MSNYLLSSSVSWAEFVVETAVYVPRSSLNALHRSCFIAHQVLYLICESKFTVLFARHCRFETTGSIRSSCLRLMEKDEGCPRERTAVGERFPRKSAPSSTSSSKQSIMKDGRSFNVPWGNGWNRNAAVPCRPARWGGFFKG